MSLLEEFQSHLCGLGLPAGRVLAAVSGGPDSVALLDLLVRTRPAHGLEVVAAHVDHGLHPDSGRIAEQVRQLASHYGLQFELGHLCLKGAGETEARRERYAWLHAARLRLGAGYIMTAHHADDQVETVLMRVLEGSGPAGLAGIAGVSGYLVRPLLPFRHSQVVGYLQDVGLEAWLDPANADGRHLRSWIRTDLLPRIRARLPQVDARIERVAQQAARNRQAWDAVLEVLPDLDLRVEPRAISVAASVLAGYDSDLRQAVMLAVARRIGCTPGPSRASRVFALLESGRSGARVPLGSGWTAELTFGRLRITADNTKAGSASWALERDAGEGVWGRWRFRWGLATAPPRQERVGLSAWFLPDTLIVRPWLPGEKLTPLGGTGRRLIVRCFQDVRVPRTRRGSWPVLAQNDDVIWVPGVCRSDARIPAGGTEALRVDAEYA